MYSKVYSDEKKCEKSEKQNFTNRPSTDSGIP